jgi:Domain of unknown function (DUF4336)
MLRTVDTNLWVAEQPLQYFGLEIGTRMSVIRLVSGQLWVHSPIGLTAHLQAQIDSLGCVGHIVAPNLFHYRFANAWKQAYPQAHLWATTGLAEKRADISIDACLSPSAGQIWPELELMFVDGLKILELQGFMPAFLPYNEWVFYHPLSRSLLLTDLAFYFDANSAKVIQRITRLLGGYQQLRPTLLEKMATRDKAPIRQALAQILAWDFDRVIMAHGSVIETDGKRQLQLGYEWFLR